jgi:hypothetical protein
MTKHDILFLLSAVWFGVLLALLCWTLIWL